MQDKPSLFLSGFLLISAGTLVILANRITDKDLDWLRGMFIVAAAIIGGIGFILLLTWISWTVLEVWENAIIVAREASEAKYPVVLAHALAPLPTSTAEFVGRSTIAEVFGIMDQQFNLEWRIRAPGIDVDYGFAVEYIEASKSTAPYLWPVDQSYGLGQYQNAERQAAALTTLLVTAGWADPASGNKSARLLVPWRQLAERFGVEEE